VLQLFDVDALLFFKIEAERLVEKQEKLGQLAVMDLYSAVLYRQALPNVNIVGIIYLEVRDVVLIAIDVGDREFPDDHQDEQVKHHPGHDDDEYDPEDQGFKALTAVVTVPHSEVPVLAGRSDEEREQS